MENTEQKKRLTLALDHATYKTLKLLGAETGRSNQEMMEAALKEWLAREALK